MNNGVGPAFIKSFEVLLDGNPVKDMDKALREVLGDRKLDSTVARFATDYAMSAGEKRDILILAFPLDEGEDLEQIEEKLDRFDLIIKYASVYGQKAQLDTRTEKSNFNN